MNARSLAAESLEHRGFFVPQFEVRIEGVGLPRNVLRDVVQVTYKDNLKEIDSFELTINNWDADSRRFKYVGDETAADLKSSSEDAQRYRLFDPCNKTVEVWMGYAGDLRLMLRGTFTTLEPSFTAGEAPTLAVRGLNVLHQLRRKQYSDTWGDKRDSDIAKDIATKTDKDLGKNHKRFPLPIVIDENARGREEILPYVAQKNQYDIDFLLVRARKLGYVVYVREADPTARNPDARKQHLYFGPSDARVPGQRDVEFKLRWGATLTEFKPTLTTANQVKSVTVNGWDPNKKKAITVKASLGDKDLNVNADLHELLKVCDPREELVIDKPVHSEKEAKQVAQAILKDRQKEMVKASGATVGLPDLRAGRKLQIEGLGARFNGTYFITESTHTLNNTGYTTRFGARREVTGALKGLQQ